MNIELRKTGIAPVGDVPWGTHFCQFYQSKEDLIETLVPYFRAGLENNEFCMWVTSKPVDVAAATRAITEAVPNFSYYIESGQIEIISYKDWYLKSGYFDMQRVLDGWVQKLGLTLSRGFAGLRLTGNTMWLERKDWKNFVDYEEVINNIIGNKNMLALCTYSLDRCSALDIMDVISNHEFALVKQAGKWEILENSSYKMAKTALIASELRFRMASEASHTMIYDLNVDTGEVLSLTQLEKFLGYKLEEMVFSRDWWYKIIHPQDIKGVKKKIAARTPGNDHYTLQYRIRHNKGHYIYIEDNAIILRNKAGKATNIIGSIMDISERKKIEQLKDDFIGMVSHEFRTPLTVISGCLNTILTEKERLTPEETKQLLRDASEEADMLGHLLGNLLDLSRYEAGKLTLNIERTRVEPVIKKLVKKFRQQTDKHRFVVKIEHGNSDVLADTWRIERILHNLIENAVKYSPDGCTIKVSAQIKSGFMIVSVADRGIGISTSDQKKLFAAFSRLTNKGVLTRGVGLGLLVCQRLVEAQGGHIWVESKPGYGSTFSFSLPLYAGKEAKRVIPDKSLSHVPTA